MTDPRKITMVDEDGFPAGGTQIAPLFDEEENYDEYGDYESEDYF